MRTIVFLLAACAAGFLPAADHARLTLPGGTLETVPLAGVREADGGVRYTLSAAQAARAERVDFVLDRAHARKGEDGFWLYGRGVLGRFDQETMRLGCGARFLDHPYYAMRTPRGSFLAIVEGMRFDFDVVVTAKEGRYEMRPSWSVKATAFGNVYEDLSVLVYDLPGGAGYVEMAKRYRARVLAREGAVRPIETLKERAAKRPHLKKLANAIALRRRHACKPYVFKDPQHDVDYTPETEKKPVCNYSFARTLAFLKKLKSLKVDDVALCVAGWQDGGYDGRCPSSFPVSPEAGGEEELKKLIRGGQKLGYIIDGHSNYTDCYAVSPLWDGGGIACKGPDGKPLKCHDAFAGGRAYNFCLKNAWETFLPGELEKIAALGFRGAHYIDVFTAVFPYACCDPKHPATRRDIADCQRRVVEKCIALFGGFSSECDMDHLIGLVDYVNYNTPARRWYKGRIGPGKPVARIVPFTELAFHDYQLANPDKTTQEFATGDDWLDLVEFGGRPIVYNFTDDDAERIRDLYNRFKPFRRLQMEEMTDHREVLPGVARVTYGDGSRVWVNHTDEPQQTDGVSVPAKGTILQGPPPKHVHVPVVVEPARGYNSWPMLGTVGGKLVCVYTMGTKHDPGEKGRGTFARTSADGGRTWGPRVTLTNDPRCGETPVAKGVDENGAALFWIRRYGPKPLMALYRTTDGERFELISEPMLDKGPMMQITDVFRVPGVGLMSFWFGGSYEDDDRPRRWGVMTSADNGKSWTQRTVGANMKRAFWPTEPAGVYVGDGRILCVARTEGGGRQLQLTSSDSGATWQVRETNIRDVAASTPSLIYDPKTGLVSNYYYQRGPGILRRRTAKLDEIWDRPECWPASEMLVNDGGTVFDSGNANAVELNGRHYVTYYTGRHPDCAIAVLPIDPVYPKPGDWGVNGDYTRDWAHVDGFDLNVTLAMLEGHPYDNHQQGIAVTEDFIFSASHDTLLKMDWTGKPVVSRKVQPHMGDITWYKGRLYATWGRRRKGVKESVIAVFDENLNQLGEAAVPCPNGLDGITVLDDTIYFGVNDHGQPFGRNNHVGRMTLDLKLIDFKPIDIGIDVNYGVQNFVAADGKLYAFFYTHLGERPGSPVTCGVFDRDLKLLETKCAYSGQGIDVAPKRFQTVPGRTVFVTGGSSHPRKTGEPPSFKRFHYTLRTLR